MTVSSLEGKKGNFSLFFLTVDLFLTKESLSESNGFEASSDHEKSNIEFHSGSGGGREADAFFGEII